MGTATTFAQLMARPTSKKIALAEINPAELLTGWSLTGGQSNTYEISYLNESITLADSTTETITKEISSTEEDATALTERASIATVEANAGSFWHDTANAKLYVHPTGSDDPADHTMVGFFWLYFATEAVVLNSTFYEPYLSGVPALSARTPNIHWGVTEIGGGSLTFLNGRGYFDQISKAFIWTGKTAKILIGGDALAYGEYQTVATIKIIDKSFTRRQFLLKTKSNAFRLLRKLPVNNFWVSDYANLEPNAQGRPIPYYYGIYDQYQAPEVTCINTAYDTNTYQFEICDHAIKSITQVYIDYDDGSGWQTIAHGNEDLTNAKFTIVSASFVVGTTRVKVAFEGKEGGGSLLEKGPYIAEDILTSYCGYAAADLNSTAFTTSKARTELDLNVPIEKVTSARSIIQMICLSDLAYFDEDGDGLLRYRTWQPEQTGTEPEIDETDLFDGPPRVVDDTNALYWKIFVGYGYRCAGQSYLYAEESSNESKYKYEKDEDLKLKTYVRGASHADTLAQRLLFITRDPSPLLSGDLKLPVIDKTLGDKIKVTMSRAPYSAAGGYDKRVFELFGSKLSLFPFKHSIQARDLMDYGGKVGFWTDATAPAWSSATQQQKDDQGFWSDANGYADPTDQASLNVSRWW